MAESCVDWAYENIRTIAVAALVGVTAFLVGYGVGFGSGTSNAGGGAYERTGTDDAYPETPSDLGGTGGADSNPSDMGGADSFILPDDNTGQLEDQQDQIDEQQQQFEEQQQQFERQQEELEELQDATEDTDGDGIPDGSDNLDSFPCSTDYTDYSTFNDC